MLDQRGQLLRSALGFAGKGDEIMNAFTQGFTRHLNAIGRELVQCSRQCEGVRCNRRTGHIPRCLFLETDGRSGRRGSVIVGLNPGHASDSERTYYLERHCTFDAVTSRFEKRTKDGKSHPYYRYLRRLVDCLDLDGPILWTELAHCETKPHVTKLSSQTLHTCTSAFLVREVAPLPRGWPLIAVGRDALKFLPDRFPDRTVIGTPHPTGSRGHFHALFRNRTLRRPVAAQARKALHAPGTAVWLDA